MGRGLGISAIWGANVVHSLAKKLQKPIALLLKRVGKTS
jgi:hypothetical protein